MSAILAGLLVATFYGSLVKVALDQGADQESRKQRFRNQVRNKE